ncbi:MAG: hypothetical protein P1U80_14220 [Pseudomonadales bacterium]|nr:hypothetical protein [Pseudomonadales bacterium]
METYSLSSIDLWRLCDELTIIQASLLLAGEDPEAQQDYVESHTPQNRPSGYDAAKAAISRGLLGGYIEGQVVEEDEHDINGNFIGKVSGTLVLEKSYVKVDSLRQWLSGRGVSTGFFFPAISVKQNYLDHNHPRYSAKLAAAISAWLSLEDTQLSRITPKQALEKWLRENASDFNLCDEDGKPNETGIIECAKVANWQTKGGAPRTPEA